MKNKTNEKYESYLILKRTIEENFQKDMQECVDMSNQEIEKIILKERNINLNKNEKISNVKGKLLESIKKHF